MTQGGGPSWAEWSHTHAGRRRAESSSLGGMENLYAKQSMSERENAFRSGGAAPRRADATPHSCQGAVILCPFRAISKGIKPSFFASRVALLSNAREQPPHAQARVMIYQPSREDANAMSNVPRPPPQLSAQPLAPRLRLPVPGEAACERAFAHGHGMRGVPALCTAATQTSA